MPRPETTRLKIEDCAALPISAVSYFKRLHRDEELDISGTAAGVSFCFTVKVIRGRRGWVFVCPKCQRTARTLYFPPGCDQPGCRNCLQLVYDRQYWSPDMRIAHAWFAYDNWKAEQERLRRSLANEGKAPAVVKPCGCILCQSAR
jgi:hypothetical protein